MIALLDDFIEKGFAWNKDHTGEKPDPAPLLRASAALELSGPPDVVESAINCYSLAYSTRFRIDHPRDDDPPGYVGDRIIETVAGRDELVAELRQAMGMPKLSRPSG